MVRLSGPSSHAIALDLLNRTEPLEPRRATFGRVGAADGTDGRAVDQVVATWFAAPHSFTGDEVVELCGHGSPVLLQQIVERAMRAGARLAEPGEFTFRAYLNGRLDLVQAEAVADLVDAVTPLQARAAMDQLEGTLTAAIGRIDAALFDLAARLEGSLDFPDEGFHFVTREQAGADLDSIRADLEALVRDGRAGRVLREGSLVVIAGRPNAGKSSLFNALVGSARAIVTDVPGTTRDVLTERADLDGLAITLVDTAGLRDATDAIEREGVARARGAQQVAALTVLVLDGERPLADACADLQFAPGGSRLVVLNKADRPRSWPARGLNLADEQAIEVSALTGAGLPELKRAIAAALTGRDRWRDPPAISNVRHLAHAADALDAIARAAAALGAGATEELVLADLAAARRSLEAITGARTPDEVLAHIFSRFCVGK